MVVTIWSFENIGALRPLLSHYLLLLRLLIMCQIRMTVLVIVLKWHFLADWNFCCIAGKCNIKKTWLKARTPGYKNWICRANRALLWSRKSSWVHISCERAGQARWTYTEYHIRIWVPECGETIWVIYRIKCQTTVSWYSVAYSLDISSCDVTPCWVIYV